MKKLIVVAAFLLAGCGSHVESKSAKRFVTHGSGNWDLEIVEDTQTGCLYLQFDGEKEGGITPLLTANGQPDCSGFKR